MKHLLLTGKPGIGKTTLIEKLIDILPEKYPNIQITGFITKEVRSQGSRIGFNIHTLNGKQGVLARVEPSRQGQKYRVGKYFVELEDLETIGISSLRRNADIIVLDEIGKMELFSQVFKDTLQVIFDGTTKIIGSIAWYDTPLIKKIKESPNVEVQVITKQNRDHILEYLLDQIRIETQSSKD